MAEKIMPLQKQIKSPLTPPPEEEGVVAGVPVSNQPGAFVAKPLPKCRRVYLTSKPPPGQKIMPGI